MSDRDHHQPRCTTRRRLLRAGLGATALGIVPGAGQLATQAQAAFDWKRFKGQKISVLLVKSPRGDLLTSHHQEFENLTGIAVTSEMIAEALQCQKAAAEFKSKNTSFDVVAIPYHLQKRLYGRHRWLADVRPLVADKAIANPSLDFADFSRGGMAWATQPDGRIDSLPSTIDPWMIYYNKELFDAKNVAYPRDFGELMESAAKLHDPGRGIAGFVTRGSKNANVPCWTSLFLGYGGRFVDAKGRLMTASSEAVEAAKMYKTLLVEAAPNGVIGFSLNEAQTVFRQGRVAMWLDGSGFAPILENPATSRIAGRVGYGVTPAGPKQHVSAMFGDGEGISTFSKKKGPSWLYLQWATNKANQARLLQTAAGAPARVSAYGDVDALSAQKIPGEWVECMVASAKIAQPALPIIVPVAEFRDIFGAALANMLNGADPAAELKKATAEFQPILDKSEKRA